MCAPRVGAERAGDSDNSLISIHVLKSDVITILTGMKKHEDKEYWKTLEHEAL